jgi:DNA-binding IclR family transcriptional regulator
LLSTLPDEEIHRITLANQNKLQDTYPRFDVEQMWQRIRQARKTGYLVNDVLEVEMVRSVAMPILDPHGRPVGAISISALSSRFSDHQLAAKIQIIKEAVAAIETKLLIHTEED